MDNCTPTRPTYLSFFSFSFLLHRPSSPPPPPASRRSPEVTHDAASALLAWPHHALLQHGLPPHRRPGHTSSPSTLPPHPPSSSRFTARNNPSLQLCRVPWPHARRLQPRDLLPLVLALPFLLALLASGRTADGVRIKLAHQTARNFSNLQVISWGR